MLHQSLNIIITGGSIDDTKRPATATTSTSWQERLVELKQYQQAHGNCLVPGRYKENPPLGRWVESQVRIVWNTENSVTAPW